jgi:hypothetical protein
VTIVSAACDRGEQPERTKKRLQQGLQGCSFDQFPCPSSPAFSPLPPPFDCSILPTIA